MPLRYPTIFDVQIRRDSVVGVAIHYELYGSRIECRWRRDFPRLSRPSQGPTQPPGQWVPGHIPGGKAAGAWY